jgi:hypothetical protein
VAVPLRTPRDNARCPSSGSGRCSSVVRASDRVDRNPRYGSKCRDFSRLDPASQVNRRQFASRFSPARATWSPDDPTSGRRSAKIRSTSASPPSGRTTFCYNYEPFVGAGIGPKKSNWRPGRPEATTRRSLAPRDTAAGTLCSVHVALWPAPDRPGGAGERRTAPGGPGTGCGGPTQSRCSEV